MHYHVLFFFKKNNMRISESEKKFNSLLELVSNNDLHNKFIFMSIDEKVLFYNKEKKSFYLFEGVLVYDELPTTTERAIRSKVKKIVGESNKNVFNFYTKNGKLYYLLEKSIKKIDIDSAKKIFKENYKEYLTLKK